MKHLLLLLAMAGTLCGHAQQIFVNPTPVEVSAPSAAAQPLTASPTAYQWGLGEGNFSGLGTQAAGTFGAAVKVPGSGFLKDGKVVSVNLPVIYTGMTNVRVWGRKSLATSTDLFSVPVPDGSLSAGYNEIMLETPYTITGDFYLGYTFTIPSVSSNESKYPIGILPNYTAANSLFLSLGGAFQDYSSAGYGVSALQMFVEDIHIADYAANFSYEPAVYSMPSTDNVLTTKVVSACKNRIGKIEYTITVDGQTETRTATVNVPAGLNKAVNLNVKYSSPAKVAPYTIDLYITKIDGRDNESTAHTILEADNLSRVADRMTLVEEYTGTGCGYCPRGWVGMEAVKKDAADKAVAIAVHQYNNTDPMFIEYTKYADLPVQGAPSAVVNREGEIDPYYGSSTDDAPFGILDDITRDAATLSPVAITNVCGIYASNNTKVDAKADFEFLGSLGNYRLEFVLTADSLTGTSSSWRQTNYYYQYTPAQAGVSSIREPELASFCRGGANGKNAVFLTFNDVAIASSYVNSANVAPELPLDFQMGDKVTAEYTLTMPTRTTLKNAIKSRLVFLNVLVFNENNLCVNCARARVLTPEEYAGQVEGIEQVRVDAVAADARRCNLAGQTVGAGYKGIVIVGGQKQIIR